MLPMPANPDLPRFSRRGSDCRRVLARGKGRQIGVFAEGPQAALSISREIVSEILHRLNEVPR